MNLSREFCLRAYRECLPKAELVKPNDEDPIDYLNRIAVFFSQRFDQFGTIYLLPHHFVNKLMILKECYELFLQDPEGFPYVMIALAQASGSVLVDKSLMIGDDCALVEYLDGDFDKSYLEDVIGDNIENLLPYCLAGAAITQAIITSKQDITIGCHHNYDPHCFLAGVFGSGRHCLLSSIEQYQYLSEGFLEGDVKMMGQMVAIANWLFTNDEAQIIQGPTMAETRIRLTRDAVFGFPGETFFNILW